MKVDLITLHNVKNYGSVLQTYATQTILEQLGCQVEVINYFRKDLIDEDLVENRIKSSSVFSKNMITRVLGKMLLTPSIKKQCKVFNQFLEDTIHLTPKKYYTNEQLKGDLPIADIYCTGSDQVWNSDWNQGIELPFFLDFIPENKKKIAYAASFGKAKLDEKEKEITKKLLSNYQHISVRESTGLDILEELGIQKGEHVLDPTLLLVKAQWQELEETIPMKGKYILVYQLNSKFPEFDSYVKRLSKYLGLPVVRLSNVIYQKFKYGRLAYCPSVKEFISYFLKASYIVTDSFHATAYAINFNKKFVSIFPPKFGSRLASILKLTGLEQRRVQNFEDMSIIEKEIDYQKINQILQQEREKSLQFLKEAVRE